MRMKIDTDVREIVVKAVVKFSDAQEAIDEVLERIRNLPHFPALVDDMIRVAVQDYVFRVRHENNRAMRKQSRNESGRCRRRKATQADASRTVQRMCRYNLFIDGHTLGDLRGEQLQPLADRQREQIAGLQFHVELLERLAKIVPPDRTVRQAVPLAKLNRIWKEIEKKQDG